MAWVIYLSNRCQVTACNNSQSDLAIAPIGVQQGSIPGPLLFTVYINDLPDRLDFLDITLCADDTVLFIYSKSIYSIDSKLNSDLDKVSKWFISHQLTLNINKTKFIIIDSSQRLKKLDSISITTDDKHKLRPFRTWVWLSITI